MEREITGTNRKLKMKMKRCKGQGRTDVMKINKDLITLYGQEIYLISLKYDDTINTRRALKRHKLS